MTRIPTLYAFERSLGAMSDRRAELVRIQEQLSSGKRVNSPGDAPLDSAQAERTRSQLARIAIERRMTDFARGLLSRAETAMAGVVDALQFARDQLLSAGNGAQGPEDRALIAQQLRGTRDDLLALANQRDGSGGYLFGGQGSSLAPFDTAGKPVTSALAGEQATGGDVSFTTSQDGRAIFIGPDPGPGGTDSGIFATLEQAIALLEDPSAAGVQLSGGLQQGIDGIDATLERVLSSRTRAGEQLRALDSRERLLESGELEASGRLSDLVDLDYAAAIPEATNHQTALEAAMATYARVARLSLFDYL